MYNVMYVNIEVTNQCDNASDKLGDTAWIQLGSTFWGNHRQRLPSFVEAPIVNILYQVFSQTMDKIHDDT